MLLFLQVLLLLQLSDEVKPVVRFSDVTVDPLVFFQHLNALHASLDTHDLHQGALPLHIQVSLQHMYHVNQIAVVEQLSLLDSTCLGELFQVPLLSSLANVKATDDIDELFKIGHVIRPQALQPV